MDNRHPAFPSKAILPMSFSTSRPGRSLLDRAVVISLAAMAAMNLLVLAHQLQPEPTFAAARTAQAAALA